MWCELPQLTIVDYPFVAVTLNLHDIAAVSVTGLSTIMDTNKDFPSATMDQESSMAGRGLN